MRCIVDPDLPAFAAEAMPWLHRDPVRHNLLRTITQSRLDGLLPLEPDALWLRLVNGAGELVGAGVQTPPRGLVLSTMSVAGVELIADHLASIRGDLPAVDGPEELTAAFVGRFTERTGREVAKGLSARIYQLNKVTAPSGVTGRIRAAAKTDRELLIAWLDAFGAEALAHQPRSENAPMVDRRLEQGGFLWLWEDSGVPVSLLMVSRPTAGVVGVSAVYTPPELRGHGYASGNVAAICQRALDDGAGACMLYADRANPTSNRVYQRIGFRPVGDTQEWVFTS
jgi:predicted GNAT family acetyltransferase